MIHITAPSRMPARRRPAHADTGQAANAADVTAIPLDRSAEVLTKGLVQEDELIILLLRPSLWYVVLSSLGGLLFIALMTFALAYVARRGTSWAGWTDGQAFALGLGLAALRLGWQFVEWMCKVYVLTDRRVIVRSGALRVAVFQALLKNIQHASVFEDVRERLFGLGTIGFATAGSDTFEAFWEMVRRPHAVHHTIVQAIHRYGR